MEMENEANFNAVGGPGGKRFTVSHFCVPSLLLFLVVTLFFFSCFIFPFPISHVSGIKIGIEARFDAGELRGIYTPTLCAKRMEEPPG